MDSVRTRSVTNALYQVTFTNGCRRKYKLSNVKKLSAVEDDFDCYVIMNRSLSYLIQDCNKIYNIECATTYTRYIN